MTIEQKQKVAELVKEFAKDPDIVSFVQKTESRIATTKGHYDDYMAFFTPYASKPSALYIISQACLLAGASYDGVSGALSILRPA